MKYVLFVGSRVGYEAITSMAKLNCKITHVFIEQEHVHEHLQFYEKIIQECQKAQYDYSLNAGNDEITSVLDTKLGIYNSFDYIMSFGYRRIIPERILGKAAIASLGVHFSPLPRYRGFAPLNWVLINGEQKTAVNLFCLDKEVDNGDIVDREFVAIDYRDDINTLYEKCICEFRKLLHRSIPKLETGKFETEKQDSSKATYACARSPEDGVINWNQGSREIYNLVRALTYPFPGAFTYYRDQKLYIWSCEEYSIPQYEGLIPGKVIKIIKDTGIVVLCGTGAVLLKEGQLEGDERKTLDEIITSIRITLGHTKP